MAKKIIADAGSLVEAQDIDAETSASAPAHLKNDKRFTDMMKIVRKLGEESSLGSDSMPKLAQHVIAQAADGVIDTETKNAKGEDAAELIYNAYVKSESSKAVHEHKATKVQASKLRQLIKVGNLTTIDAVELMQEAMEARANMLADSLKVKSSYPYYVEVARAQLKTPTAQLDKDELERMACVDEPKEKTIRGEIKRAMSILENLITGEGKSPKDTDELTDAAFQALRDRFNKIETEEKLATLRIEAAKLGVKLV